VIFTILGWFVTKCEVAGMRVIIIKYKAMVLCQKKVNCPLWVGRDLLPKVEEFKHLGVISKAFNFKEMHFKEPFCKRY